MKNSNVIDYGIEQKYRRSVCIGNQVLNGTFTMSLREYKLLYGCINQFQEGLDFTEIQKVNKVDLKKFMGIEEKNDDLLLDIIKKFRRRELSFENESMYYVSSWIWKAEFHKGYDYVEILFNPDIVPQLTNFKKGFTKCEAITLSGAKCTYTERLYPILKQYVKIGVRKLMVDEIVKEFILPKSYLSFGHMNKHVIKPAIDEINRMSDIKVKTHYIKDGRKVIGFVFDIAEKPKEKETVETTIKPAVKDSLKRALLEWCPDIILDLILDLQAADEATEDFEKRLQRTLEYCKNQVNIGNKSKFFYSTLKKDYSTFGIAQDMFKSLEAVKKYCETCKLDETCDHRGHLYRSGDHGLEIVDCPHVVL